MLEPGARRRTGSIGGASTGAGGVGADEGGGPKAVVGANGAALGSNIFVVVGGGMFGGAAEIFA